MQEIYDAIQKSAVIIADMIAHDNHDYSQQQNATGDIQLELDIRSDKVIEEHFAKITSIKELASEEKEGPHRLHEAGKYLIGYDPLDGSSLANVNLSVGSIFGIYENDYSGSNLKAAVYVVYGPRVEMVTADENGVQLYRAGRDGAFYFVSKLQLDQKGKLNAPGGTQKNWAPYHKSLIESFFADGYRLRYSGGMVPDLHQILIKGGGIFSYPGTSDVPAGKLRKVFEVFPFAFVYECAGGEAIDGHNRLLDLKCDHIHDTTPCFFGSKEEIKKVRSVYANH
jgi:fructose-1,6-bisphosphatase I